MKTKIIQEINKAKKLIENKDEPITEQEYSPTHLFTTENIKGITDYIDFENKEILLPCSSGDHIFNALVFNVKNIKTYDINALTKYVFELKKAAIIALSKEEFLDFFFISSIKPSSKSLNRNTYYKISEYLPKASKRYWDYLYATYTDRQIRKSKLFSKNIATKKAIIAINPYLEDKNYELLKEKLKDFELTFYNTDINILSKYISNLKFDYIYLSNIADYFYCKDVLAALKQIVLNLKNSLKPDGKIGILYLYSYKDEYFIGSKNQLYNIDKRNEYFPEEEYSYIDFASTSVQKLGKTRMKVRTQDQDGILTYQNKNNY